MADSAKNSNAMLAKIIPINSVIATMLNISNPTGSLSFRSFIKVIVTTPRLDMATMLDTANDFSGLNPEAIRNSWEAIKGMKYVERAA